MPKSLLLGNEAIARGAWEAGAHVASSYPGTPSTEITSALAKLGGTKCEWAPNEKVAVEVAFGAAMTGARAIACMKHVGVNVAADPLYTAAYTGINGGLLIVCADDPAMHSSQNEQDSRMIARAAHIPMLEPADSQECIDFVKLGFELSEKYDTPVFLRTTTRLSHSRSVVETGERTEVPVRSYEKATQKYVMMPGMAKKRHIYVEQREKKMVMDASDMPVNRMEMRDKKLGVICAGAVYQYVREALPDASILKLGLSYPLPEALIREFAQKVDQLVCVEELEGVFEKDIRAMGIQITGKEKTGVQGELSAAKVRECFSEYAAKPLENVGIEQLPVRPPVLCPGCPHRATFYVLKKLKLTVFGDIGCYTLCALPPLASMDSALCMGASIGMAFGAEKANGKDFSRRSVAVLGDSTFVHSGITPLIDAVYNGGTITVVIMDNRTTAMTGHQNNPANGLNIYGEPAPELNLAKLCESIGAHVETVDPYDLKEFERVIKQETARESVSVVIAKRPCALLKKKNVVACKVTACRNCGACMAIGCPAIIRGESGVQIDDTLCVGCGLCSKICPFKALDGGKSE